MKLLPKSFSIFLSVALSIVLFGGCKPEQEKTRPNIILLMTDDQGWAQTGYYHHPVLETPNLDAMAENGLRLDRFYAGAPVCSPTRASVLTGRANDRTGVPSHGHALRLQEKTIAEALQAEGYATGHFGKWHLNALRGPGVPIFKDDPNGPAGFGFDMWVSVTNFFDLDPLMSDQGEFKALEGTSSEVIVDQAVQFIRENVEAEMPFFAVIWDGSPHRPFRALEQDSAHFRQLDPKSQAHYGELVAFDRSVGVLRDALKEFNIAENTIVWYCSDNGGLPDVVPSSVNGLRGFKGSVWEGGLRVPAIIEWPAEIEPRITEYPASTMDIFPTLADILDLPRDVMSDPIDGISIQPIFSKELRERELDIPFRFNNTGALIDNNYKLVATNRGKDEFELYDLQIDPGETEDISATNKEIFNRMKSAFLEWSASVDASVRGEDYPEGKVRDDHPIRHFWNEDPRYEPYFEEWVNRPEYKSWVKDK